MAYLSELHPEVFFALPRPGGIVAIEEEDDAKAGKGSKTTIQSSKSSRSKMSRRSSRSGRRSIFDAILSATPEYVSREYRIKYAMETSPWVLYDEDIDVPKPPNPLQDSIDLLTIVITTVMLLAAKHGDISAQHLKWTLSYLENVKDEFGNNPPNVRGIMNHIKKLNPEIVSFNEDEFDANADGNEDEVDSPEEVAPVEEPAPAEEDAPAEEPDADEPPAEEPPAEEPAA